MTTNYEKQDVAQVGQVYDTSNNLIISIENNNDALRFGDFVVNDSGNIVKWNSDDYANKKPVGVVLYNALDIEGKPSDKSKIPVISRGTVWVSVDEADAGFTNVKKGSIAYLNAVNGEPTGFIDDVITNQKIGVFVEDSAELNEGGHLVAIELKLFAKNLRNMVVVESYPTDPVPSESTDGEIYYNSTHHVDRVYLNGNWETIVTSTDIEGNYVVKNSENRNSGGVDGEIYYDLTNNNLKTHQSNQELNGYNGWQTLVTTSSVEGDYVLRHHESNPTNYFGSIYYNTNYKTIRASLGTSPIFRTVVTTENNEGNYVFNNSDTSPTSPVNGMHYYNSTENSVMSYANDEWAYLNPKPYFHYTHSAQLTTSLPSNKNFIELQCIENSNNSHSFLFSKLSELNPGGGVTNGIIYNGELDIRCKVSITVSGEYITSNPLSTDGVFEIRVNDVDKSRFYFDFQDSLKPNTAHLTFTHLFSLNETLTIKARHESSDSSANFTILGFSILCEAI